MNSLLYVKKFLRRCENSLGSPTSAIPATKPHAKTGAPRTILAAFPYYTPPTLVKDK